MSGMERFDIAIVGGGAAGLAAAIFAASSAPPTVRTIVIEGAATIGAKILISGGGRCNVTNVEVAAKDFNGRQPVVRNILAAFDEKAAARWFASLGVPLVAESTGKLFPEVNSARAVVDGLLRRCTRIGVTIRNGHRIIRVEREADRYVLHFASGAVAAGTVILATGGRSLPRTGSDGVGFDLARRLGHSVTETFPALVPLLLKPGFFHRELSGLSQIVELTTRIGDKAIDRRTGSLLFTHFGISGPVVLDASRHWVLANAAGAFPRLICSFFPASSSQTVESSLLAAARARPRQRVAGWLEASMPARLAQQLSRTASVEEVTLADLTRAQRQGLVQVLAGLELPVQGARGWDFAEVTAGGVPLAEIDYRTMESRRCPGLYLVGEMLDCDGRIGGFNFQWAWATGFLAGRAAAHRIQSTNSRTPM